MSRRDSLFLKEPVIAVGAEVFVNTSQGQRYGVIVQVGSSDDHPGAVLVYEGPEHEYPAWWSQDIVTPAWSGKGRVTDRRLDQRLRGSPK